MPSAARKRAFWAPWSCCSNIGKCAGGGEKFCQLLKKLRGVGLLRPGGTLPSGRPSRQARLAPHGLPTGAAGEKSSGPAARREADRPSREPFAQDRKRTSKGKAWMPFLFACGREPERTPIAPLGCVRFSLLVLSHRLRRPARSRDSVSRSASFLSRKLGKELSPPPARFFITCTAYTPSRRGSATWRPASPPRTPGPGGSTAPGRCRRPPAPAPPSRRRFPSPRQTG